MSPTQEHQLERAVELSKQHLCAMTGPYGYVCTDRRMHDYAHYDASEDASWTDDWNDQYDVSLGQEPVSDDLVTMIVSGWEAPTLAPELIAEGQRIADEHGLLRRPAV